MAGAEARLDEAGVALWLTDWKVDVPGAWTPRRVMALVGDRMAGRIDFLVHPDGQALSVWGLEVEPAYQHRHLASVMTDALCAAHPAAWIDYGGRGPDGARGWDRYTDPAPERNIHNRPMSEWAKYFNALDVARQRATNAYHNKLYGLDGQQAAEYRYGERLEDEALENLPAFQEPGAQGPDPAVQELYGGLRVALPARLHRVVHDGQRDSSERAGILLDHVGHGNLPSAAAWNTTLRTAFEDIAHDQLLNPTAADGVTHLVARVRLAAGQEVPPHDLRTTWLRYLDSPGIAVELTGMSWRSPQKPWATHNAGFTPPLEAAIAPERVRGTSPSYTARYGLGGELLPGRGGPHRTGTDHPYAGRAAEIAALAASLQESSRGRQRAAQTPPPPSVREEQEHQHNSEQQQPGMR